MINKNKDRTRDRKKAEETDMPFTPEAPQFLFENYTRNDKEWFKANKETYEREVLVPMREMIEYLTPLMKRIDSRIVCSPKKISRIYKDVRLMRDGMFFKKSIWFSLMRPKEQYVSKPEFFFWISPDDFGWGCGYYHIPTHVMDTVRTLILNRDKAAMKALDAYDRQESLVLDGEPYKRDRFPNEPLRFKNWLNRRNLAVLHTSDDAELFFGDKLCERVKADFERIAPVYELFIKAEDSVAAEDTAKTR